MTTEGAFSLPAVDPQQATLASFWERIAYLTTRTRSPGRGWLGSPEVLLWNLENPEVCTLVWVASELNVGRLATGVPVGATVHRVLSIMTRLVASNVAYRK
jgi:hypothetical protein